MADLIAQRKVFDIFTRQAMFIEQVKAGESAQFNNVLAEIEEDFRKQLGRVDYQTLDGLSKARVQALVRSLKISQSRIYSKYQQGLLDRLKQFMLVTVKQTTIAAGSFHAHTFAPELAEEEPVKEISEDKAKEVIAAANKKNKESSLYGLFMLLGGSAMLAMLWPKIKNAPMPSGGALLLDTINLTIASNMMRVSNAVMHGWVNKLTVAEVLANVIGTAKDGNKSAELTKVRNTMRAVTATIMQHVGQQSIAGVNSAVWPSYVWVSVIDGHTSDICRSRHMNVYKVGQGPLPPAHPHCRSHTVPEVESVVDWEVPTLFEWLKSQPQSFLSGLFGGTLADKFADGSIRREDFNAIQSLKSITVGEFLLKTADLF